MGVKNELNTYLPSEIEVPVTSYCKIDGSGFSPGSSLEPYDYLIIFCQLVRNCGLHLPWETLVSIGTCMGQGQLSHGYVHFGIPNFLFYEQRMK